MFYYIGNPHPFQTHNFVSIVISPMNHPLCPSIYMSCKPNFSLMDEQVLIKLYTVTVYDPRMCTKKKLGFKIFQGDHHKCGMGILFCDFTQTHAVVFWGLI